MRRRLSVLISYNESTPAELASENRVRSRTRVAGQWKRHANGPIYYTMNEPCPSVCLYRLMAKYEDEGKKVKVLSHFFNIVEAEKNKTISWSKLVLAPFREVCLAYLLLLTKTHMRGQGRVVASRGYEARPPRDLNPLLSDDGRAKLTNERNWFWKTLNINRNPMWSLNF